MERVRKVSVGRTPVSSTPYRFIIGIENELYRARIGLQYVGSSSCTVAPAAFWSVYRKAFSCSMGNLQSPPRLLGMVLGRVGRRICVHKENILKSFDLTGSASPMAVRQHADGVGAKLREND